MPQPTAIRPTKMGIQEGRMALSLEGLNRTVEGRP